MYLTGVETVQQHPRPATSTLTTVYYGRWQGINHAEVKVCIKVIRKAGEGHSIARRMEAKMSVWANLHHANVVPVLGICNIQSCLAIVTPCCQGDVLQYISSQPNCDRLKLMLDMAEGLRFLHGQQPAIAHKAIKATNVLVKQDGRACLVDYELSWLICDSGPTLPLNDFVWQAPEVLSFDGNGPSPFTVQADVYSFAMVSVAILAGQEP